MQPRNLIVALALFATSRADAQRKALSVVPLVRLEHKPTDARVRYDSTSKKYLEYRVDGRIDLVAATRDFVLSWNGADGRRRTLSWEPPNKVSAIVEATVRFDSATKLYTYDYTFVNRPGSEQRLKSVFVECAPPIRAGKPDDSWYSTAVTPFLRSQLQVQDGWVWSHVGQSLGIAAGATTTGFSIISDRPPAIVRVFAVGATAPLQTSEEPPKELHDAINAAYYRVPNGYSIGPAPRSDSLRDTRASVGALLLEAERQGWFGGSAEAKHVRAAVDSLSIDGGAGLRAKLVLDGVRAGRVPGLLSEAQALIEFRAMKLHDRRPQR